MRFLAYLEKAWIAAAICSLAVGVINFIRVGTFDNRVYFPIFCAGFCMLIWYNVRGQRRFREKVFGDGQQKPTPGNENSEKPQE